MNKSQLIEKIAAGADISKAAAGRALDSLIVIIQRFPFFIYVTAQLVQAVIHKQVQLLKSQQLKFQHSKLVKH